MTYHVEVDGVVVPASVTAGATSHREAALKVAPVNHAGRIITVVAEDGDATDRRWFQVVADAETGNHSVVEVALTRRGTLVPVERDSNA